MHVVKLFMTTEIEMARCGEDVRLLHLYKVTLFWGVFLMQKTATKCKINRVLQGLARTNWYFENRSRKRLLFREFWRAFWVPEKKETAWNHWF